ncbi:B-glycosyltransferase-related protein, glycosyltransferase family 2 [Flavobacterium anhuiense]|uniref:B-glycosyltransferase-related protein, glycosyltransferase family 2 n=1 Tax=Flavobacterium anhuiense TaxID=459526 RepID=A0A444VY58_9FLAO|nr:glycosyltransferase [Flavobacterium anhuiense]RYJ38493.1 B-glycosyltransferase-related protein, glycosyltransferase family 2 [Flavobacterium anhuiense]
MLSILIPVYNYDVLPLVSELVKQCNSCGIIFEIIVQDDASNKFIDENNQINSLENCFFSINKENLGRGRNINSLCSKSKYNYVLIMEADAFPESKSYLNNYIDLLSKTPDVIFGGVKYPDNIPPKEKILRWKYGRKREIKSLSQRLKNKYDFVFTWNLLLKREILLQYPFPEFINEYGYEDLVFIKKLQLNSVPVIHIENSLIHFNHENSVDFINKTEKAVRNLYNLISSGKIDSEDAKLTKVYVILKKLHLTGVLKSIYNRSKKQILHNLTSKNPNLYVLDFYKLGYYCDLKQ